MSKISKLKRIILTISILGIGLSYFLYSISLNTSELSINAISARPTYTDPMSFFWSDGVVINESLLPLSTSSGLPEASLLFTPARILSVKDSALSITYQAGKDWILDGNKIKIPAGSHIPYLKDSDINPPKPIEGTYFHSKQLAVTYMHRGSWQGPIPKYLGDTILSKTQLKLNTKTPLKVILIGDSIAVGANVSGYYKVAPLLPIWGKLFTDSLSQKYQTTVEFINQSAAGKTSSWGLSNIDSLVASQNPDLVIIAFGMNDGTNKVSALNFKNNLAGMIDKVNAKNPNAEFILISPTLANPISIYSGTQSTYTSAIKALIKNGTAMIDMTGVHTELLKTKKFSDMTGNNINHPNDFLARWYAQQLFGLFVGPSISAYNGQVIKKADDPSTYLVENSTRRGFPNWVTFLSKGYSLGDQKILSDATVDSIPLGETFPSIEGKPVKGTTDIYTVYLIENGLKRRFTDWETYISRFKDGDQIILSDKGLNNIPTGLTVPSIK